MPKAYKRMPVHKRVTKSMIPKPQKKYVTFFEEYQSKFLSGIWAPIGRKHSILQKQLVMLNARQIRKHFRHEPMPVIDRLVSMSVDRANKGLNQCPLN